MYWIQFLGFVLPYVKVAIACWLKKKLFFVRQKEEAYKSITPHKKARLQLMCVQYVEVF